MNIIYNIDKTKVLQKFREDIEAMPFDVDGTLIDVSYNLPGLDFPTSWKAMEVAAGLDKDKKYQKYFKQWLKFSEKPGSSELKSINKKINSFWKGKHKDKVSKYLYPILFLEGVLFFFDKLNKKRKWVTGIISSAPDFYVREIADLLKIKYFNACQIELDEQNFLTGKFKSNGLYEKEKSLEDFCKKFSLKPNQIAYHGDSKPDIPLIRCCSLGIVVNPHPKFKNKIVKVADVLINAWYEHPLLELL